MTVPEPSIAVRWRRRRVDRGFVARVLAAAQSATGTGLRLSVTLTGDAEIQALNRTYLGHDYPTDVLAFGLGERRCADDFDGEIVVSVERAVAEAHGRSHGWRSELALYLVHGVLHLCGHDDGNADARAEMIAAEQAILARLHIVIDDRR